MYTNKTKVVEASLEFKEFFLAKQILHTHIHIHTPMLDNSDNLYKLKILKVCFGKYCLTWDPVPLPQNISMNILICVHPLFAFYISFNYGQITNEAGSHELIHRCPLTPSSVLLKNWQFYWSFNRILFPA